MDSELHTDKFDSNSRFACDVLAESPKSGVFISSYLAQNGPGIE